jgi:LacI family transcriptional regulator
MPSGLTMKDVAKKAGVSLGTVSNVINNIPSVKEENRQKVLAAMEEMQFIPNMMAKQLRSSQSSIVGLILPTIQNPYYAALAEGVSSAADACEYSTMLFVNDRDPDKEIRMLGDLVSSRVAGVIIAKSSLPIDLMEEYSKRTSIVLLDSMMYSNLKVDVVSTTDYEVLMAAVKYVREMGHSRIAYMAGDMIFTSAVNRMEGFKAAMHNYKLKIPEEYITEDNYSLESGYARGVALLSLTYPPTAIICANDILALGVYQAAEELHIKIPEQLSVIGCDNTTLAHFVTPRLTTIDQQMHAQGAAAVQLLMKRLKNPSMNEMPRTYILQAQLIEKNSCAPVKE